MELKGFTKLLLSATLVGASGQAAAQKEISFVVTNQERQTIDGFGASDAWSMWQIGT
jgi:O-glycosyl hydrolase